MTNESSVLLECPGGLQIYFYTGSIFVVNIEHEIIRSLAVGRVGVVG